MPTHNDCPPSDTRQTHRYHISAWQLKDRVGNILKGPEQPDDPGGLWSDGMCFSPGPLWGMWPLLFHTLGFDFSKARSSESWNWRLCESREFGTFLLASVLEVTCNIYQQVSSEAISWPPSSTLKYPTMRNGIDRPCLKDMLSITPSAKQFFRSPSPETWNSWRCPWGCLRDQFPASAPV